MSVFDKTAQGGLALFLGLVDSEAWAFGRLQDLELSDGRTVRQHMLDWQRRGAPADEEVVPDAQYCAALAKQPPHLRTYLDYWLQWHRTGRDVLLHEPDE